MGARSLVRACRHLAGLAVVFLVCTALSAKVFRWE